MEKKNTKNDSTMFIPLIPDTDENRETLTKDLTAALRWFTTSDGHYDDDSHSAFRLVQMLEVVSNTRRA